MCGFFLSQGLWTNNSHAKHQYAILAYLCRDFNPETKYSLFENFSKPTSVIAKKLTAARFLWSNVEASCQPRPVKYSAVVDLIFVRLFCLRKISGNTKVNTRRRWKANHHLPQKCFVETPAQRFVKIRILVGQLRKPCANGFQHST